MQLQPHTANQENEKKHERQQNPTQLKRRFYSGCFPTKSKTKIEARLVGMQTSTKRKVLTGRAPKPTPSQAVTPTHKQPKSILRKPHQASRKKKKTVTWASHIRDLDPYVFQSLEASLPNFSRKSTVVYFAGHCYSGDRKKDRVWGILGPKYLRKQHPNTYAIVWGQRYGKLHVQQHTVEHVRAFLDVVRVRIYNKTASKSPRNLYFASPAVARALKKALPVHTNQEDSNGCETKPVTAVLHNNGK